MSADLIDANFKSIQSDIQDMKSSMAKIADALTKIAVLEERHQVMQAAMNRIVEKLDAIDQRQATLEIEHVKQQTTLKVSLRSLQVAWAVLGSGMLYGAWQVVKMIVLSQAGQ